MPSSQWKQFNCYDVLAVLPTASPQEIRTAYKQAGLRHHPDRGGSHEAQVRVNIAYEVLFNPIERQAHDIHWSIYRFASSNTSTQSTTITKARTTGSRTSREPLAGYRRRVYSEVEKEKARIWQDLKNRAQKNETEFLNQYAHQRLNAVLSFIGLIAVSTAAIYYPVFWIGGFLLVPSFCQH
jgi:curved DNA-binding protein CbpA